MTETSTEWKYDQLAEMGVGAEEIQRIRDEDIRTAHQKTPVPDGGDAHEHVAAGQVDVPVDPDLTLLTAENGYTAESTIEYS